jgi:PAS domain S-box-containing protein
MKEIHQFASALSMKWYTECELQKIHQELEQRVEDRTRKLKESEERYRALAENSMVGFWQTTLDGHTIYINPAMCKMLEVENPNELRGKTYHSFFDVENQEIIKHELAKREKGISSTYEIEIIGKKGRRRNVMTSGAPIFSSEDKVDSTIATFTDITERKQTEKALKKARDELEVRVKERTMELSDMLEAIKRSEEELIQHKSELEKVNKELFETNRALSVLARNIDREKEILENKIYNTIVVDVMPVITELQNNKTCQRCLADLEVLKAHLNGLFSGPTEYQDIIMLLTEQEMRVAALIKKGMTNNQIGNMLFISEHTVKTHRRNIRKKLKIQNSNINLGSYLKSKFK